eukprot:1089205-Amphidinium_carterae.1
MWDGCMPSDGKVVLMADGLMGWDNPLLDVAWQVYGGVLKSFNPDRGTHSCGHTPSIKSLSRAHDCWSLLLRCCEALASSLARLSRCAAGLFICVIH